MQSLLGQPQVPRHLFLYYIYIYIYLYYIPVSTCAGCSAGTNACYTELQSSKVEAGQRGALTAVNTEWGGFWSEHMPQCAADEALDAESIWPGQQLFEKAVGGYYLGEVVRRCVLRVSDQKSSI
jgi:hexokinase